jgi:hypothetical protein
LRGFEWGFVVAVDVMRGGVKGMGRRLSQVEDAAMDRMDLHCAVVGRSFPANLAFASPQT